MDKSLFEDSLHPLMEVEDRVWVYDSNRVIVLSNMIKQYNSRIGVGTIFSNSSHNIFHDIVNSEFSRIVVYFDFVYDNQITIENFITLLGNILCNGIENVIVVPIHCIEWHCIKAFGKDSELKDIVLNCKDYRSTKQYMYNMNRRKATNEKFCKAVMGDLVDKKFHGSVSIRDYSITSIEEEKLIRTLPIFYTNDCNLPYVNAKTVLYSYYDKMIQFVKCNSTLLMTLRQVVSDYFNMTNI